jgi:hypothetical protein
VDGNFQIKYTDKVKDNFMAEESKTIKLQTPDTTTGKTAKIDVNPVESNDYQGFLDEQASASVSQLVTRFTPRAIMAEVARQLQLNSESILSDPDAANSIEGQKAYSALAQAERIRNASARI